MDLKNPAKTCAVMKCPKSPELIHVAAAVDEAFVRHLGVMLKSLLVNTSAPERIRVHVISGDLAEESRLKLRDLVEGHRAKASFIQFDTSQIDHAPTHGHVELATYYRLFLHQLLPGDIDRCLYLDGDMVVLGDIAELWAYDLDEKMIGGVLNHHAGENLRELGTGGGDDYVNAGVLLVNLKRWREERVEERFLGFIDANRERLLWHDQDTLNACFAGDKELLPEEWNLLKQASWDRYLPLLLRWPGAIPKIVHFSSASKPWHADNIHPCRGLYWKYLRMTPWRNCQAQSLQYHAIKKCWLNRLVWIGRWLKRNVVPLKKVSSRHHVNDGVGNHQCNRGEGVKRSI